MPNQIYSCLESNLLSIPPEEGVGSGWGCTDSLLYVIEEEVGSVGVAINQRG